MAQATASMAGLGSSSPAVMEGSLQLTGGSRLVAPPSSVRVPVSRAGLVVIRAHAQSGQSEGDSQSGRRVVLGLVSAAIAGSSFAAGIVYAQPKPIKIGPPPPPSGGLPGTLNSDEPRDLDLPYKDRFYIQPLPPAEAAARAKESAKEIVNVKEFIDKKQWPYVINDLRLRASCLRYDLNTVIAAKPKEEKKSLKDLTGKLFETIGELDHAAKRKNTTEAEKYYAETKSALGNVLAKLG